MTTTNPTAAKVLAIAASQIGYHEGRSRTGSYNNDQKYSDELPGFKWSDFQAWCATFMCWCFWKADLLPLLPSPSASCDVLASGFKKKGQWGTQPKPGAIVFYGTAADLSHTGIVESFTSTTITTIEGNTNDTGSREGDGVYRKTRARTGYIIGYGYPAYPVPLAPTGLSKAREQLEVVAKRRPRLAKRINDFLKGTPKR